MTRYSSTIEVRCWKEHICVNCGGSFAYLLVRKVTGPAEDNPTQATNEARACAVTAIKTEVDSQPCPTCGLYQPDMIGAQRARWHKWIFSGTLCYLALLLIMHGCRGLTAETVIWLAAVGCAVTIVAHVLVDWDNANSDLQANMRRARCMLETGRMQAGHPGNADLSRPELRAATWSSDHRRAYVLIIAALGLLTVSELVRSERSWPINADWHPPVAGPGDETYIYLPDSINSVNGYWSGTAAVSASIVGNPNEGSFPVKALTSTTTWGKSISVKGRNSSSSRLWVSVRLPERPDLVGKRLLLTINLDVTYPADIGMIFSNERRSFNRTAELQLSSANAGRQYNSLWWLGIVGGGGLLLTMSLRLIQEANALKRQAHPTKVYPAR
jgi:hypothetical protein